MKTFKLLSVSVAFVLMVLISGCSKDTTDESTSSEPETVYYSPEIDNSFLETLSVDENVPVSGITTDSGDTLNDGDTVSTRVIHIYGQVPDDSAFMRAVSSPTTTIYLEADGGTCMEPGPWDTSTVFSVGFAQNVSVSYSHDGVMCTGDYGFIIRIVDSTGTPVWGRELDKGLATNIDTTYGSTHLQPGTYQFYVTTVTGTRTHAQLTYTPGGGGQVGATVVIYHNGNLYPVAEAVPGATFDYTLDLVRGDNTIRVLIIGNFDQNAQQDIANIFGASDPITLHCITDEIGIRATLTWGIDNADVDLHLIAPGGQLWTSSDCYFSNMQPEWGDSSSTLDNPILDIDNTHGYGPETVVLPSPEDGLYTIVVHYWSDHGGGDAPSSVVVTLNETTQRRFGPQSLSEGEYWIVTGISVENGTAEFAAPPDSSSLFNPALKAASIRK